jgi:hypothetical protein
MSCHPPARQVGPFRAEDGPHDEPTEQLALADRHVKPYAKRHVKVYADSVGVAELSRLARTVRAWEAEILAFHSTGGCSNGPTEAMNLLIKKVKRVGHGFRNFTNYRLRLLLHCGVSWQTHQPARLRGRSPNVVAWRPGGAPANPGWSTSRCLPCRAGVRR